jgi:cytoskeletal protein RodZ
MSRRRCYRSRRHLFSVAVAVVAVVVVVVVIVLTVVVGVAAATWQRTKRERRAPLDVSSLADDRSLAD